LLMNEIPGKMVVIQSSFFRGPSGERSTLLVYRAWTLTKGRNSIRAAPGSGTGPAGPLSPVIVNAANRSVVSVVPGVVVVPDCPEVPGALACPAALFARISRENKHASAIECFCLNGPLLFGFIRLCCLFREEK